MDGLDGLGMALSSQWFAQWQAGDREGRADPTALAVCTGTGCQSTRGPASETQVTVAQAPHSSRWLALARARRPPATRVGLVTDCKYDRLLSDAKTYSACSDTKFAN